MYTHKHIYTLEHTGTHSTSMRIPCKAAGFFFLLPSLQFIVNYLLSSQAAGVNAAGDPFYFSLFISYFPLDLLTGREVRREGGKKERKKKH